MPKQRPNFDSIPGHVQHKVVMPVYDPDESLIHFLEIPIGMHVADLHEAIVNLGYHQPEPTKENAIEYSPEFRKAAADAWAKVGYGWPTGSTRGGNRHVEAGFTIDRSGHLSPVETQEHSGPGEMSFLTNQNTLGIFHTHADPYTRRPSSVDESEAKRSHVPIYTASKDGLFYTGADGATMQIFKKSDWATSKKP